MSVSQTKRKIIWDASDHRCRYCHRPLSFDEVTVDHIIPRSNFKNQTVADDLENLCIACRTCNAAKAAMSEAEFRHFVNEKNNAFLKLEADYRVALARVKELSKEMDGKKFSYIRHLRECLINNF